MEADNQSKSSDNFQQEIDSQFDLFSLTTENSSSNTITTEELMISKLFEKLGCLSAEVETIKTVLLEKNNTLVARLETMEQKLRVAELEKKLANEQMAKAVEVKMNKMNDQLEEKQRKFMEEMERKFEEKLQLMKNEMAEGNAKLKKKEPNDADANSKKTEESKKSTFLWSTNKWEVNDQVRVRASGLVVIANENASFEKDVHVCAAQPITREILASMPGLPLVYYEVKLKKYRPHSIGWVDAGFPVYSSEWVGKFPGSYAIFWNGDYWKSGFEVKGFASEYNEGDVVGTGLLLTRNGELKVFFTKNYRMSGKPIPIDNQKVLYSAISFWHRDCSIEANFGADTENKPFKFDIGAHEAQLFV